MKLDSARELKQRLTDAILVPLSGAEAAGSKLAVPAGPVTRAVGIQPSIALGIAPAGRKDFRLAVRCQQRELLEGAEINRIRKRARDEVDIRYVGAVTKRAAKPWYRRRHRPLLIGSSIGHHEVTAGTLGAVVRPCAGEGQRLLSNNHVLANENKGKAGDPVIQPGSFDGGLNGSDTVAVLDGVVKLRKAAANRVDCATATPARGIEADARTLKGLGKLAGLGPDFVDAGTTVAKVGRTTGLTHGRVTAFELDNVIVGFDVGNLRFDGQIEIEGEDEEAFSDGGDSGSLIVEADTRLAVALLFAGTDLGGTNGQGLTYANPIRVVLDALDVDLVTD